MNDSLREVTLMSNENHVVSTSGRLSCEAQRAWEKVCFYEHIETRPSLLLRTALPVPVRTTGTYGRVGDVSRCMYSDGGYLAKRITHIIDGKRIDFEVIEQTIRYAGRIVLKGGTIEIESHEDGTSSVHMLTRYERRWPAHLIPRFLIDHVVSAMHKIVIRDMQVRLVRSPVFAQGRLIQPHQACGISRCIIQPSEMSAPRNP
jgi:hypothetical protein